MNKDKSISSSSLSELSTDEVVVVDEIDHYAEEWIPPFAFREGISLNRKQKISDFYKFEEPLGEGKFGRVFKCIEKNTQLCLAAKCIKIKKDSELKQVENEISILTKMRHKCIAQIYDAYYIEKNFDKEVILIMEIVEGGELFDRVVEESYILTELAIALIIHQICEAIKYIHSHNFIHLDLKPENIMCVSQSSNQIKLIDFGLAQHYDGEQDLLFMAGTPEFAAPEVIKYEPLNFHTDMWSVGVITYILLSGQSPFLGPNIAITYNKVEKGDWSFCNEFEINKISQDAKEFISKLLIVKKEDRMLPEDCLNHSWLKNSLDKAHNLQNKKEITTNVQPINKETLKKYLKNKKFRRIVFGVLFINQVLKMITTMQLKRNKKGLLYAKNLLHAAKLSEKKEETIESIKSTTEIDTSTTNITNKEENVNKKKILKVKKVPKKNEEDKVEDKLIITKTVERKPSKTNKALINKIKENDVNEIKRNVELTESKEKSNSGETTKKSSSLKENRDTTKDILINDDNKYLNDSAKFSNTANGKQLHSINEKINILSSIKDCDKQKNVGNIEEIKANLNSSSKIGSKKLKNSVKKNTKCLIIDNTKLCNKSMENIQTNTEEGKLIVKVGDSKKNENTIGNKKIQEKESKNSSEILINSTKKEEDNKINHQVCGKNSKIMNDKMDTKEKSDNNILIESKEVLVNDESIKKIKKTIKRRSIKKKVQIENKEDCSNSSTPIIISPSIHETVTNNTFAETILNKKTYSAKNSNTISKNALQSSSLHLGASASINNYYMENDILINKKIFNNVKDCKEKCNEKIEEINNDTKIIHNKGLKNTNISLLHQESKNTSQKISIKIDSDKQVSNKETNKIERKKCIIRKKNIKKDDSDIVEDIKEQKYTSINEPINMKVEKEFIDKTLTKNNDNNFIKYKEESHKNISIKKTKTSLITNLKKNISNDTLSIDNNIKNDFDDEEIFNFKKLKEKLEKRLSNKKPKDYTDSNDIDEVSGKLKDPNSELFEYNGLSKVDFENVKNIKNKWLKIEKEAI
ncbi:Stretchin-Mlck [Strongyloides ratti]|uniref:Stretchin-Mlck n=1 Tax=Strongyloides ratti TaxID=34506 RepID=A0A090KXF5_STRRB|nr:Stretchin-Mlck [Strongyloides ratti]CEF60562.1 Stretchin-Mlck [Strongyloides ratti]